MAALLDAPAVAKPQHRLINIQPKGSRPPLYWLFGGPTVQPLADTLGPDQPFFGVALDPEEQRELSYSSSMGDIAAYFVRIIREVQPHGPYFIGGWCLAGILGYEVAYQLEEAGEEVGLLVLVHATNPVHFLRIGNLALGWSKLKHHLATLLRLKGRRRRRYAMDRVAGVFDRVAEWFHLPPASAEVVALNKIIDHAAIGYAPKPYSGDVALFQPADRPDVLDYRPGWREVVRGGFAAFEIAGAHRTMLEYPNVVELAARMNACLRRAQATIPAAQPRQQAG
jgi:thioesterase domain-containing protein